jgi:AcrR family transcriptional regulator
VLCDLLLRSSPPPRSVDDAKLPKQRNILGVHYRGKISGQTLYAMTDNVDTARRVGRPRGPAPDPAVRRAELLDAAERVIRAQGPQVGMDDIAAEIGLTKPAVYRSLGDKAELTAALGERVGARLAVQLAQALAEPAEPGDAARVRAVTSSAIDVFCRFVAEDTNLYRFIVHGSVGTQHTGVMDKPLVVSLGGLVRDSLAQGMQRAGVDPAIADTWAYAMLGAVFAATEHWRRDGTTSRAELVARLTALLCPAMEQSPDELARAMEAAGSGGRPDPADPPPPPDPADQPAP